MTSYRCSVCCGKGDLCWLSRCPVFHKQETPGILLVQLPDDELLRIIDAGWDELARSA